MRQRPNARTFLVALSLASLLLVPSARAGQPAVSARRTSLTLTPGTGGVSVMQAPPAGPAAAAAAPGFRAGPQGGAAGAGDDPAAELMRVREEQSRAYQSLNALNPFSSDYGKGTGAGTAGALAATGPLAQLQKLLAQPAVQGYLRLFSNPAFSAGIEEVMKSPNRMLLLYAELGWIVFMLVLRAWRFSKSTHWVARLWTRLWTFALFSAGSTLLVPVAVLGEPYYRAISGMFEVLAR